MNNYESWSDVRLIEACRDGDAGAFALTAAVTLVAGGAAVATTGVERDLSVREGYAVVAASAQKVGVDDSEEGLDLVEVAPQARPPVCRLMDYGKYKYERDVRQKEARKRQSRVEVKEIKFRPKIDTHDYEVKMRSVTKFLNEGDKVKVTMMFRGRQITHPELGMEIMERLTEELADVGNVEQRPTFEGRVMTMILAPQRTHKS
jgi:translation initiation factor IF-3